jgi:hypothetical protein
VNVAVQKEGGGESPQAIVEAKNLGAPACAVLRWDLKNRVLRNVAGRTFGTFAGMPTPSFFYLSQRQSLEWGSEI